MLHMKNDDMDELFRKAAENYSVDTTRASDWERVSAALKESTGDEGTNNTDKEKKKKRRGFFLWWILLFPAGWMAHNTWHSIKAGKQNIEQTESSLMNEQQPVIADNKNAQNELTELEPASAKPGAAISSLNNKSEAGSSTDLVPLQKPDVKPGINEQPLTEAKPVESRDKKIVPGNEALQTVNGSIVEKQTGNKKNSSENRLVQSNDHKKLIKRDHQQNARRNLPVALNQQLKDRRDKELLTISENGAKTIVPLMQQVGKAGETVFPAFARQTLLPWGNSNDISKDSNVASVTNQTKKVNPVRQRGFYLQALVAADITTVQYQKITGIGNSAGLLVGYQFNKRWHVEGGALWEKKAYYTKGEYFDTSKLGYLASHKIYAVDGNCYMITIPLSARYNLAVKERSKWFLTAGIAAYLMNKENYDIKYDYYGQERERNYSYYDAPKSWFATIKLSAGYEHSFWKTFNFRVEPYIRIPATGVGTGKLSLQSAGIFLGVGKKF